MEQKKLRDDESLWICFAPLCTHYGFPSYRYFLDRFAQFTGKKTIAIDIHGVGNSSRLGIDQVEGLFDADFDKVLDPIYSALSFINARRINIYGYSMGGRLASASVIPAKRYGIDIEQMILVEPGGATRLEHVFGIKSLLNEVRSLGIYNGRNISDPLQRDAMKLDASINERIFSLIYNYLKPFNGRIDNLLLFAYSMQSQSLERDLLQSLQNSYRMKINFISGDRSSLSKTSDIQRLLQTISPIISERQHESRLIVLEGESHPVGYDAGRLIDAFKFLR